MSMANGRPTPPVIVTIQGGGDTVQCIATGGAFLVLFNVDKHISPLNFTDVTKCHQPSATTGWATSLPVSDVIESQLPLATHLFCDRLAIALGL